MAKPGLPARLYKYQPFGPHTGLNLTLLVERSALFFPRKHALNDPTDCEPHLVLPRELTELRRAMKAIADSTSMHEVFRTEASEIDEALSKHVPKKSNPADIFVFSTNPKDRPAPERAVSLIQSVMKIGIGTPRIYSMSSDHLVGQMWSHYAAGHRGFCLALSGFEKLPPQIIEQRVSYTTDRPQTFLDDVLSLTDNASRTSEVLKKLYCVKSASWQHESEYRLIARDDAARSNSCFLALPDGDFYQIPTLRLEAVYFGQNCSESDKTTLKKILTDLIPKEDDRPPLFSIVQSAEGYELETEEVPYSYRDFWRYSKGSELLNSFFSDSIFS